MAIEDTKNMINALDKGDTVEAEKEIKAALADKVGSELDIKRKDLAMGGKAYRGRPAQSSAEKGS